MSNEDRFALELTPSWSESAYDWLLRSQQIQAYESVPQDPASAAWAFVRPSTKNGTGMAMMDAALKNSSGKGGGNLPVLELRGDRGTGKTWILVTLAARFVVATRPSQFRLDNVNTELLPQVVILDSDLDILAPHLQCAVQTALLRELSQNNVDRFCLDQEVQSCLSRIHLIVAQDIAGWVPILELLRCELSSMTDYPTLLLWDGFLTSDTSTNNMEVIRQLTRLLRDCTTLLVISPASHRHFQGLDKLITQKIRLERLPPVPLGGHEYAATIQNTRVSYTISFGGVSS